MHREIQIKQFPIVTTHWWPKTQNERFVWENEQYLYRFLPLVHNHVQVKWVRTHIRWQQAGLLKRSHHYPRVDSSETTRAMTFASAPRFRHALRQAWARARAHTSHTGCVCALISLGHCGTWLCTRGKKQYKYCSFSHTNRSFCVLGHQCVVTMGNCLIWISLCMFFFPLIETVTYTCHYMTDRLERFDLKTSKLDLLKKKRHLHLGCTWGKLIDIKF